MLSPRGVFYLGSVAGVEWGREFAADYNAQIEKLIHLNGVPEWAPGLRAPTRDGSVVAMRTNLIEDLSFLPQDKVALIHRVRDIWGSAGAVVGLAHIPDNQIVLIEQRVSNQTYIDIVDLQEMQYMLHYEYSGSPVEVVGGREPNSGTTDEQMNNWTDKLKFLHNFAGGRARLFLYTVTHNTAVVDIHNSEGERVFLVLSGCTSLTIPSSWRFTIPTVREVEGENDLYVLADDQAGVIVEFEDLDIRHTYPPVGELR